MWILTQNPRLPPAVRDAPVLSLGQCVFPTLRMKTKALNTPRLKFSTTKLHPVPTYFSLFLFFFSLKPSRGRESLGRSVCAGGRGRGCAHHHLLIEEVGEHPCGPHLCPYLRWGPLWLTTVHSWLGGLQAPRSVPSRPLMTQNTGIIDLDRCTWHLRRFWESELSSPCLYYKFSAP